MVARHLHQLDACSADTIACSQVDQARVEETVRCLCSALILL